MAGTAPRRSRWVDLWMVAVLVWCVIRIVLAEAYLSDYGVDIRIFAIIEIVSSLVLARSSANLVQSLVRRASVGVLGHGALALLAFGAPDAYLLVAGRGLSWGIYAIIGLLILLSSGLTAIQVRRSLAAARRQALSEPFDNL